MRHRTKTVLEGTWFKLVKSTNPDTKRTSYYIQIDPYKLHTRAVGTLSDIREHFDPSGNRGSKYGTKWKYRDKETPAQLLTMAILKFGG
jgi:hypothetical protein